MGNVIAVYDEDGDINLFGADVFGKYETGAGYRYFIRDHLGSTRVVVNESGGVEEAYEYYPFGRISRSTISGLGVDEKFTGKELDNDNDERMYYFGARYYDGDLSKWLSVDPLADKYPGWSPYNYVMNNPLLRFDPDGRSGLKFIVKTASGIYRRINRGTAHRLVAKGQIKNVNVVGSGSSKGAKKFMKDTYPCSKLTRHDARGKFPSHHQLKNNKKTKTHANYDTGLTTVLMGGILEAVVDGVLNPLSGNDMKGGFGNASEDVDGDGVDDATDEVNNTEPEYILPEPEQGGESEETNIDNTEEDDNE